MLKISDIHRDVTVTVLEPLPALLQSTARFHLTVFTLFSRTTNSFFFTSSVFIFLFSCHPHNQSQKCSFIFIISPNLFKCVSLHSSLGFIFSKFPRPSITSTLNIHTVPLSRWTDKARTGSHWRKCVFPSLSTSASACWSWNDTRKWWSWTIGCWRGIKVEYVWLHYYYHCTIEMVCYLDV